MEIFLLLLPVVVLLSLGWTHFPAMTFLFVGYLAAFGVRALLKAGKKEAATSRL
jgi:hypothetical protein